MSRLNRQKDESLTDYHLRLYDNLSEYEISSEDAATLLNKEFGSNYSESKWRKDHASYVRWKDYIQQNNMSNTELDNLTIKKLELQKERNKLSAEKTELNKWIREQARTENIYEKIIESISKLEPIKIPEFKGQTVNSKREIMVDIADTHFGANCEIKGFHGETLAKYSTEIFKDRMWELLERSIELIKKENISHVHVNAMGDLIDGLLHTSQLKFQELGVTDQVMQFAEFMSEWLNKLSEYVTIDYRSVLGNHAETRPLNSNRSDFAQENMEILIAWYIKSRLVNNPRINVHDAQTIVYFDVLGTKVLIAHGQDEKNLENSIKDYMMIYNVPVHIFKTGHLHHLNNKAIGMDGIQNVEFMQSPSICGINNHSLRLKKTANAGTLITVIRDSYGKENTYDVRFK